MPQCIYTTLILIEKINCGYGKLSLRQFIRLTNHSLHTNGGTIGIEEEKGSAIGNEISRVCWGSEWDVLL